ncbi:hypothetical protein I546_4899 [Mycobacterium kansasii 732]|nr:hypothetical protein I546_4899 [Mycobacterium kansasii 732]
MHPEASPKSRDRRGLHLAAYAGSIGVLASIAARASWMWLIAATMLGDNCHGDDAREICTADASTGQRRFRSLHLSVPWWPR